MSQPRRNFITVAVDGGAATGKSTTSRLIAKRFHLLHVDTGSHYRALTAALLARGISPDDLTAVEHWAAQVSLDTHIHEGSARIVVDGQPLDEAAIRSDAVNASVSRFAALPPVRSALRDYQRSQRDLARQHAFHGLIMEGRDIGSVILPDADLLIFLEADEQTRARRRAAEGQQDAVAERDRLDATRKTAPLTCPPGAERIDTAQLTLQQVVDHIAQRLDALGLDALPA